MKKNSSPASRPAIISPACRPPSAAAVGTAESLEARFRAEGRASRASTCALDRALGTREFECMGDIEVASNWADPALAGVGSDPYKSLGSSAIVLPAAPGVPGLPGILRPRLLVRLAGYEQSDDEQTEIVGLRLLSTIGFQTASVQGGGVLLREIPVNTPDWRFQDGNISFHLYVDQSITTLESPSPLPGYPRGWSPTLTGTGSAILFNPQFTTTAAPLATYQPAGGGVPPGVPVGDVGIIRNNAQFPWYLGANNSIRYRVSGKATVGLYASVLQTDPQTRTPMPAIPANSGSVPEDLFVSVYTQSDFRRVAGAIRYRKVR